MRLFFLSLAILIAPVVWVANAVPLPVAMPYSFSNSSVADADAIQTLQDEEGDPAEEEPEGHAERAQSPEDRRVRDCIPE